MGINHRGNDSVLHYMTTYQRAVEQAHADRAIVLANAFHSASDRIRGLFRRVRHVSAKPVAA